MKVLCVFTKQKKRKVEGFYNKNALGARKKDNLPWTSPDLRTGN